MSLSRRVFLKRTGLAATAAMTSCLWGCGKSKPLNILWLIAEDVCPDFKCYGDSVAETPHIDNLAKEGILFTNVFTTNSVCSPSRSAFNTGMYQTTIGAHQHRSHRQDGFKLPDSVKVISDYFRSAGYFTVNVKNPAHGVKVGAKTDWNFTYDNPFDGIDWNERQEDQPFYAQINLQQTHRKFEKYEKNPTDPDKVKIPPYYVDHDITREDWALYYDTIKHLDDNVGAVIQRLKEDDLLDNTIIIFFGDNGRPHFRGKQWLYDPGIHVPMIIRFPDKRQAGTINDNLISAIDIAPTSLALAGLPVPEYMQGQVFFGPKSKKRDFIVAARDRCDETVDRIRCVRTKQYKYIRNFYPERSYAQLNRYKEASYPVLRLMRHLHAMEKLPAEQSKWFADTRPEEELYDVSQDPFEMKNLAENPQYSDILKKMRNNLKNWIKETNDQGEKAEDPKEAKFYLEKMEELYDEKIVKFYNNEGIPLDIFKELAK